MAWDNSKEILVNGERYHVSTEKVVYQLRQIRSRLSEEDFRRFKRQLIKEIRAVEPVPQEETPITRLNRKKEKRNVIKRKRK